MCVMLKMNNKHVLGNYKWSLNLFPFFPMQQSQWEKEKRIDNIAIVVTSHMVAILDL